MTLPAKGDPMIRFTPSRQVLHGPSRMRIIIRDEPINFSNYEVAIRYNGMDVSKSFLRRVRIIEDSAHQKLVFENPAIRLSALQEHQIEVLYRGASGQIAYARYDSPECDVYHPTPVQNVAEFAPPDSLLRLIEKISQEEGINPAFSTGLVAQESAFNPRAVSWAKAVGLTQITPIAEQEILRTHPDWPIYPEFNHKPVPLMRALILSGKVNSQNEWRLDHARSIRGGVKYAIHLARRWSTPENIALIKAHFADVDAARTKLVLASYHSGYTRVFSALESNGANWMQASELSEARKYVNRILSYCSYFSEKELENENAS